MVKTENILKKLFYTAFAIFPIAIGFGLSAAVLYSATQAPDYGANIQYGITPYYNRTLCIAISLLIMAGLTLIYIYRNRQVKEFFEKNKKYMPFVVLAVGLIARFVLFFAFKSILKPFSDAHNVWSIANGQWDGVFYRKVYQNGWNNFTAWAYICVRFLKFSYPTFIALGMFVDALNALMVYLIAYKLLKSPGTAFLAGTLYAISPSVLLRDFYFSPDVYSLFGVMAGIYLLCFVFEKEHFGIKEIITALAAGLFVGLGNSVKSSAVIIAVAIIIVMAMRALRTKDVKKELLSYLMVVIMVVVPAFGVNKIALRGSSVILNTPVRDLNTWHFLNVGLNPYGDGDIGAPYSFHYVGWLESGKYTPEEARDMLIEFLKEAWRESDTQVAPWLWAKVKRAWRDDLRTYQKIGLHSLDRTDITDKIQQNILKFWEQYEFSIQQCMYVATMLFAFVGIICIMKKYSNSDGLFIVSLYVFGFALLLLLSECQPRYKSNVVSFLYILSAIGFVEFMKFCEKTAKSKSAEIAVTEEPEKEPVTV